MKYRLILWDFDGTLADTLPGVLRIYNRLAEKHGFRTVEDPTAVRGLTMHEFLTSHRIPLAKVPLVVREIVAAQRSEIAHVRLHEHLPALLPRLARSRCRLGVVSSNAEENIRACLRANGVEECFAFVAGYSRLLGKHHALRRVLKQEELVPGEALYIGDEVRDVLAARAVGIDVAAVCWGINSEAVLARHAPTFIAVSAAELAALVETWLAEELA